jgi:hypothetical protein
LQIAAKKRLAMPISNWHKSGFNLDRVFYPNAIFCIFPKLSNL